MKLKPIKGFPDYTVSEEGKIYNKHGKLLKPFFRKRTKDNGKPDEKRKAYPYIKLYHNGICKNVAVISLVAKTFIENWECKMMPKLKDGNPYNTNVNNIVWENLIHTPKYGNRHEAKMIAKCKYLRAYYETLDESYIHKSWRCIVTKMKFKDFKQLESNMFEYFYQRCKRFTLVGNPLGLMLLYSKTARKELKKNTAAFNENIAFHYSIY